MPMEPQTPDRYLVLLHHDKPREAAKELADVARIGITRQAGRRGRSGKSANLKQQCAIIFDRIGVALVRCAPDQRELLARLAAAQDSAIRSEEHTSELQSLMRTSYAV